MNTLYTIRGIWQGRLILSSRPLATIALQLNVILLFPPLVVSPSRIFRVETCGLSNFRVHSWGIFALDPWLSLASLLSSGTLWPILALSGPFSLSLALSFQPWHSLALFLVLSLALSGIRCLALFFLTLFKNLRKNPCLKTWGKFLGGIWHLALCGPFSLSLALSFNPWHSLAPFWHSLALPSSPFLKTSGKILV